jgi:superfamily II helicase
MNTDKQEYDRFIDAMLQAKFQSAYTDEEIMSRAIELVASGNVYAKRAIERLTSECFRGNFQANKFWDKLESMDMVDIASVPRPTPSKEDQHGLWKPKS